MNNRILQVLVIIFAATSSLAFGQEDPALKARRRAQMNQRKLNQVAARQKANAVAAAGSQMVAGVVSNARDNVILKSRGLNYHAGRENGGGLSAGYQVTNGEINAARTAAVIAADRASRTTVQKIEISDGKSRYSGTVTTVKPPGL